VSATPEGGTFALPPFVRPLIARARAADGQPPFSDQSLVDLRTGARDLVAIDEVGVALVSSTEAELVIDPDARGRGLGTTLLETVLSRTSDELLIWAHGDHPAARALAASHGLEAVRELLHLRAPLAADTGGAVGAVGAGDTPGAAAVGTARPDTSTAAPTLSAFRPGIDEDAWLLLNVSAFAHHPEQGGVTRADLDELTGEDWFDADDFLLLWDNNQLAGYCWLKVEGDTGEFYVVGVDPDRQGSGFGRLLTEAGLARLRERGVTTAHLYVEGDNTAAVRLYRSLGFLDDSIDIQYRAPAR